MLNNSFFKPTNLYKEYIILNLIEKEDKITQRKMSHELGVAVSMVNNYLDEYEKNGYIKRKYKSAKSIKYCLTKKGLNRKELLNISYLSATQKLSNEAKKSVLLFMNCLSEKGYVNLYFYGAGDVAEILLYTINSESFNKIKVIGIIDDDPLKQGNSIYGYNIQCISSILDTNYDGIVVSSISSCKEINLKLEKENVDSKKILNFFSFEKESIHV